MIMQGRGNNSCCMACIRHFAAHHITARARISSGILSSRLFDIIHTHLTSLAGIGNMKHEMEKQGGGSGGVTGDNPGMASDDILPACLPAFHGRKERKDSLTSLISPYAYYHFPSLPFLIDDM